MVFSSENLMEEEIFLFFSQMEWNCYKGLWRFMFLFHVHACVNVCVCMCVCVCECVYVCVCVCVCVKDCKSKSVRREIVVKIEWLSEIHFEGEIHRSTISFVPISVLCSIFLRSISISAPSFLLLFQQRKSYVIDSSLDPSILS